MQLKFKCSSSPIKCFYSILKYAVTWTWPVGFEPMNSNILLSYRYHMHDVLHRTAHRRHCHYTLSLISIYISCSVFNFNGLLCKTEEITTNILYDVDLPIFRNDTSDIRSQYIGMNLFRSPNCIFVGLFCCMFFHFFHIFFLIRFFFAFSFNDHIYGIVVY